MIVDQIRLQESDGHCRLMARVRHESACVGDSELWFRVPKALGPLLSVSGDPFIPALLLPAMVLEKRLLIEGEISSLLLDSCHRIQDIFATWVGNAHRIPIESGRKPDSPGRSGRGTGSFFSAGVDSFHTLLKNLDDITHLVLIDRFDHKMLHSEAVCLDTRNHVSRVAANLGKQLIVAQSNARSLFLPAVSWSDYHGAVLASMALALGNCFKSVYIPASYTYTQLQPWGSHPLLDPLWSTAETRIVHDGAEATRSQKIMDWICQSDLALQSLRVCLHPGDEYNCGRCEKCLRTMIPIYLAGKLGRSPVFPRELPVEEIQKHLFANLGQYQFAEENIALLERRPNKTDLDRRLAHALGQAIKRSRAKVLRRERKLARRERRRKLLQPAPLMEKIRLLLGR